MQKKLQLWLKMLTELSDKKIVTQEVAEQDNDDDSCKGIIPT
jgi:hypothetical protein